MKRWLAILTSGTRGDVQPLVALGLGLRRAGYGVRVVTHAPFQPLIAGNGLEFVPLDGNPNELFLRPEFRGALTYNGGIIKSLSGAWRYMRAARPLFERMLVSAWGSCQGADALIVTLPTTWGDQIADALGIPCIWALTQPLGRTGAFPSPLQPFDLSLGTSYNRLTHMIAEQVVWQPWRDILRRWRRATLRLPKRAPASWAARAAARADPLLYGVSPRVVPRPADWPESHQLTGYWFLAPPPDWRPPHDLLDFLAAGPPPVYVGFGGAGIETDDALLRRVARALVRSGQRAVLASGNRRRPLDNLPPGVLPVGPVPHSWLFPRMSAAVHHGGTGTLAESLRAGIPPVCVPAGADQFFWARRVADLGCGPRWVPARRMTVEQLSEAIVAAVGEPAYRAQAAALGEQIAAEHGVERATWLIDTYLAA